MRRYEQKSPNQRQHQHLNPPRPDGGFGALLGAVNRKGPTHSSAIHCRSTLGRPVVLCWPTVIRAEAKKRNGETRRTTPRVLTNVWGYPCCRNHHSNPWQSGNIPSKGGIALLYGGVQSRPVHRCDSSRSLTTLENIMRHRWGSRVGMVTLFGVLVLSVGLVRLVFMAGSAGAAPPVKEDALAGVTQNWDKVLPAVHGVSGLQQRGSAGQRNRVGVGEIHNSGAGGDVGTSILCVHQQERRQPESLAAPVDRRTAESRGPNSKQSCAADGPSLYRLTGDLLVGDDDPRPSYLRVGRIHQFRHHDHNR